MLGIKAKESEVLEKLISKFNFYYPQVCLSGFGAIKEDFLNNFPFINKEIKIVVDDKEFCGLCRGLDERGQLLLDNKVVNIGDME